MSFTFCISGAAAADAVHRQDVVVLHDEEEATLWLVGVRVPPPKTGAGTVNRVPRGGVPRRGGLGTR